jgi:hypothetical protein
LTPCGPVTDRPSKIRTVRTIYRQVGTLLGKEILEAVCNALYFLFELFSTTTDTNLIFDVDLVENYQTQIQILDLLDASSDCLEYRYPDRLNLGLNFSDTDSDGYEDSDY